jgi:hypothetical protein
MHSQLTQTMPPCKKQTVWNRMHSHTPSLSWLLWLMQSFLFSNVSNTKILPISSLLKAEIVFPTERPGLNVQYWLQPLQYLVVRKETCTHHIQQHWNNQNRVTKIARHTHKVMTSSTTMVCHQMHWHVVL